MIRSTVLLHAHITAASRILLPLLPAHSTRSRRTKVSYLQAGRQAHSSMPQRLGVIFLFMFLFWFHPGDGGRPVIFPS